MVSSVCTPMRRGAGVLQHPGQVRSVLLYRLRLDPLSLPRLAVLDHVLAGELVSLDSSKRRRNASLCAAKLVNLVTSKRYV
jgi:hypothetical protein